MERPGRLPADATCVVTDAPGQALDRAVAYWAGTLIATSPEAVGRLSVIQLAGGARVMGVLRRTYREGKWSVTSLDGQMIVADGIGRRRCPGPVDTDLRVTVTKWLFRGVTAKCLKVLGLYGSYGCNGVFASRTAARCAALRVARPAGGNWPPRGAESCPADLAIYCYYCYFSIEIDKRDRYNKGLGELRFRVTVGLQLGCFGAVLRCSGGK